MKNRPVRRIISWLVYAAIAFFLIRYSYHHASELKTIITEIQLSWLAPLIVLIILKSLFQALLWTILMRATGCRLPVDYLLAVWHQSLAGKYVPGSIWMMVGRIHLLQQANVPIKLASYTTAFEQLVVFATAALLVIITPELFDVVHIPGWIGLAFLPLFIVILYPHFVGEITWKLGLRRFDLRISSPPAPKMIALYFTGHTFSWIVGGVCVLIMLRLFGAAPSGINMLNAPGISAASFAVGYASLLTPSGIGVREGVFTFLLSQHISLTGAILIAFSSRIWVVIADGVGILFGYLYFSFHTKT